FRSRYVPTYCLSSRAKTSHRLHQTWADAGKIYRFWTGEGRKNAIKTVICQIDDLRLVAGNVICLVSAGLKIRLAGCSGFLAYYGSSAAQQISSWCSA